MGEIFEMLPVGWSLTPTKDGWTVCDEDDDFVAKGLDTDELKRMLDIEFALQQVFVAMQMVQGQQTIAEA